MNETLSGIQEAQLRLVSAQLQTPVGGDKPGLDSKPTMADSSREEEMNRRLLAQQVVQHLKLYISAWLIHYAFSCGNIFLKKYSVFFHVEQLFIISLYMKVSCNSRYILISLS